jgi:hypothetical protein
MTMPHIRPSTQAHINQLPAVAFDHAAEHIAGALLQGHGTFVYLEPGDATRYQISVESRRAIRFDPTMHVDPIKRPISNVRVTFGTDTRHATEYWSSADRLSVGDEYTDAIWQRLRTLIIERLDAS